MKKDVRQFVQVRIRLTDWATDEQLEIFEAILDKAADKVLESGDKNKIGMSASYAETKIELE